MASTIWPVRYLIASGLAILFLVVGASTLSKITSTGLLGKAPFEWTEYGYPLGQMDRSKISKLGPNVIVLRHFVWPGLIEGEASKGASIVPVLIIKDPKQIPRICDYGPNMVDTIKLTLGQFVPKSGMTTHEDLYEAGQAAMHKINLQLDRVWLKDLYLLHDVDRLLMIASNDCRLISSET